VPYFDAVLKDIEAHYCVDKGKVFVDGYSSGAWESYMLGCARAGVVARHRHGSGRAAYHAPAVHHSPGGRDDAEWPARPGNPIGPLTTPKNDSYGSAPARDDHLESATAARAATTRPGIRTTPVA